VPDEHVAQLTESTAHLVKAVHEQHEATLLEAAQERLEDAVVAVEAKAPTLAGLARRLAQTLSDIGI